VRVVWWSLDEGQGWWWWCGGVCMCVCEVWMEVCRCEEIVMRSSLIGSMSKKGGRSLSSDDAVDVQKGQR
jgi:hypothetical protein